jgi:hypothetical protein
MICAFCSVLFDGVMCLGAKHVTVHALRDMSDRLAVPAAETDVN